MIYIGSDHAGFELKQKILLYLQEKNQIVHDVGCFNTDRADYPNYGHKIAVEVLSNQGSLGIIICGSGNGINMSANKHVGIRSALCWLPEIATLARQHNDANIIALPARFIDPAIALSCVDAFLSSVFEKGRHLERIQKIEL